MPLSTQLIIDLQAQQTKAVDLGVATLPLAYYKRYQLASGVGLNQADQIYQDTNTLGASGTVDVDLAGVLTDALGTALTFARIKAIIVKAAVGNSNNVNVTRPASNGVPLFLAASDGIPLGPDAAFVWIAPSAAGIAVTAGTGDLITFTNSGAGTSVTYDLVIIGASA